MYQKLSQIFYIYFCYNERKYRDSRFKQEIGFYEAVWAHNYWTELYRNV